MDWKTGNDYLEEEEEIFSGHVEQVGHKMGLGLSLMNNQSKMWGL